MKTAEAEIRPAPELVLPRKIHLVGIGGDGMSSLAGLLWEGGYLISGSEQEDLSKVKQKPMLERFEREGVQIFFGHSPENISSDTGLIVRSSIISEENPEIKEARRQGIPIMKRSEVLGRLMERKYGIAIAGTAGKTTTTAMVGLILQEVGFDPSIMVGARLDYLEGRNYRYGNGLPFVVEADEFDRSFLDLKYKIAIVTNIFWGDHLDYYPTEQEMLKAFGEFVLRIPPDGLLIVCGDDINVQIVSAAAKCDVFTYGFQVKNDYWAENIRPDPKVTIFDFVCRDHKIGRVELHAPGKHNVLNAMAAIITATHLGIDFSDAVIALAKYEGAKRRLEIKGEMNGITIVDDFAHNPRQIQATLEGLKQMFPQKKIIVVFQPRQFRRTKIFLNELAGCFDLADQVIVTDISRGIGDTEEEIKSVHASNLVRRMIELGLNGKYIGEFKDVTDHLRRTARSGDVVITLGSGNVYRVGEMISEQNLTD
jgi:UDP-N-acetylmuramate--alanine ligase